MFNTSIALFTFTYDQKRFTNFTTTSQSYVTTILRVCVGYEEINNQQALSALSPHFQQGRVNNCYVFSTYPRLLRDVVQALCIYTEMAEGEQTPSFF